MTTKSSSAMAAAREAAKEIFDLICAFNRDEVEVISRIQLANIITKHMQIPEGSSICPICGKDSPHYHSPQEQERFYNYVLVPREPTEEMWSGLARSIMLWMDMSNGPKHPRALLKHLDRSGIEPPAWLLAEPEMQDLDHSMSKGSRAVLIYKAMLSAAPPKGDEPENLD